MEREQGAKEINEESGKSNLEKKTFRENKKIKNEKMKAVKHSFQTKVLVPNFLISPI
jgi:hypothetical protein